MAAGIISLTCGTLSTARIMNVFIPKIEEATANQLASFFYASMPQAILWSTAFATFFASGILLEKASASEPSTQSNELTEILKSQQGSSGIRPTSDVKRRREADERVEAIKAEVLKAIQRLERLGNMEDNAKGS
jgi:hypothetical protein